MKVVDKKIDPGNQSRAEIQAAVTIVANQDFTADPGPGAMGYPNFCGLISGSGTWHKGDKRDRMGNWTFEKWESGWRLAGS